MDKLFLKKLYRAASVPMAVYREEVMIFQAPEGYQPIFLREKEPLERIAGAVRSLGVPALFFENEKIFYGALRAGDETVILGPVSRMPVDEALKLEYRHAHKLKTDAVLCRMEPGQLAEILSLIYYESSGKDIKAENIKISTTTEAVVNWNMEKAEEEYHLEESEQEMDHNSVAYENRLLEIVRTGNVEAMEKMIHGSDSLGMEHVGRVAVNADKQAEYLSVVLITLLSRAAADGGMDQEKAYGKADIYLQRLEKCKAPAEMYALASRAGYEFTVNVREAKEKASRVSYVEQCKSYIAKNLRRPFGVEDIAEALGMNRTYLTRRFSEAEGISIHRYIMRERCEHAANMLKYSDYPIAQIGEYFCFSSQSHFGKVFREFYGMTPKEYRNLHRQ